MLALVDDAGNIWQVVQNGDEFEVAAPLKWVNADASVEAGTYTYDETTGTFTGPPARTLAEAMTEKQTELDDIRQSKIASALGTTASNLSNHEAHVFRLSIAAQDAMQNPSAWYGKTLNEQTLPSDDAGVQAAAQAIIAAQRAASDAVEVVIAEYNAKLSELAAATTAAEADAVTWL